MSDVDRNDSEFYVVEYKELFFFLFVFLFILVTLFPKELIKKEVFKDTATDYRLSIVYIKELLKSEPNNTRLKLLLAKKALLANQSELAYMTAMDLLYGNDKKVAKEASLLAYEAIKQSYLKAKTEEQKGVEIEKLQSFIAFVVKKGLYRDEDTLRWYHEAQFVNSKEKAFFFLQKYLKRDTRSLKHIEEAYYLASILRRDKEALEYLDMLIRKDAKKREKWLRAKYFLLLRDKKYALAESFLRQEAKDSLEFARILARFYLMRKEYRKASDVYLEMMERAQKYEERKRYLIKAVDALRSGQKVVMAAKLLKRFEGEYLHDQKMRIYMLRVYLASGRIAYAHSFALKTLHIIYKDGKQ